jgi:hypothetical protein
MRPEETLYAVPLETSVRLSDRLARRTGVGVTSTIFCMPIPTFNIHISGNVVAFYGAILSSITAQTGMEAGSKSREE